MASTYLTFTETGTASNQTKFTYSAWIKRSKLGTDQTIFYNYKDASNYAYMYFRSSDDIRYFDRVGGGDTAVFVTNNLFRDTSAWYHIVLEVDTTQATSSDRIKFYVNNEQVTFSSSTIPAQDQALSLPRDGTKTVASSNGGSNYFDGSMSHVHFVESTAYDPTAFGEYDANGVWKIKTSPSVTYGTNGFFILKDGNSVTDQSGNSNNFTVAGGTLTKTEDSPSNVFATWNFLDRYYTQANFSNGNATVQTPNASETYCTSTLGMNSGKYYMEVEIYDGSNRDNIGIVDSPPTANNGSNNLYQKPKGYSYRGGTSYAGVWNNDTQLSGTFSAYGGSSGDKVMIAVDLDNSKLYFGYNGTWQNSGDPTSGSTGTGAISITPASDLSNGCYFFAVGDEVTSDDTTYRGNFGNGYFGTTAVSSAGTNASGIGIFEYDVPTGYTALSTKGLNL